MILSSQPLGTTFAFGFAFGFVCGVVGLLVYAKGTKNKQQQGSPQKTLHSEEQQQQYPSWLNWKNILFSLVFITTGWELVPVSTGELVAALVSPPVIIVKRIPKRKVVLLGPHDRYNFGDLLFERVVSELLLTRAGYLEEEIIRGGLIDINMSKYGGINVVNMKRVQKMSRNSTLSGTGPFDIVYTGGEALGCSFYCGEQMLPGDKEKRMAEADKICDCAYLARKQLLLPKGETNTSLNQAVVNSLGGNTSKACETAVKTADYVVYRDKNPIAPDSAVMVKELYRKTIAGFAEENMKELFPNNEHKPYIAVQHKAKGLENAEEQQQLAQAMDAISKAANNCTIVFFAGGTAPKHDSFSLYHLVSKKMTQPNIVFEAEHVWKVVGLISRAEAVLSSSLHVRIMAFVFHKPRVTWCTGSKHRIFIQKWDSPDSPKCAKVPETWSILSKYMGQHPKINQTMTIKYYERAVKLYLESFGRWSRIINK